jgi:hypothetical protein
MTCWQDVLSFSDPARGLNGTLAHFSRPALSWPDDTPKKLVNENLDLS